jgi:hypothetical protein
MFPLFLSSLSSPTGYATDGAGYVEHHVEQKHGFTTAFKSQDLNKHNLDSRQTASYMHSM